MGWSSKRFVGKMNQEATAVVQIIENRGPDWDSGEPAGWAGGG